MRFARFAAFLRRFAPFWGVWLLVLLFPVSRDVVRLHFIESPLDHRSAMPWAIALETHRFSGFRAVRAHPHNLDARLLRFSQILNGAQEDDEFGSDQPPPPIIPPAVGAAPDFKFLREAQSIRREFPPEKWLVVLPVRVLADNLEGWKVVAAPSGRSFSAAPTSAAIAPGTYFRPQDKTMLLAAIREGAKLEPRNAFYPLVEARFYLLDAAPHFDTRMWSALSRASRCSVYDDGSFQIRRRIVAAHEAVRPLLLEEKQQVWRESDPQHFWWTNELLESVAPLAQWEAKSGRHQRALKMAAILARIGDLMQRPPGSLEAASSAASWKNWAWQIAPPNWNRRSLKPRYAQTRDFARYAASHGRPDIAAQVPVWAARQNSIEKLQRDEETFKLKTPLRRAEWGRNAGAFIVMQCAFVAAFWMAMNILLWRGRGAASSRRARAVPALVVAVACVVLALGVWQATSSLEGVRLTPASRALEAVWVSAGVFAAIAPPFLLALWCASATMWQRRAQFGPPSRFDTQLRLAPLDALWLRCGPAALFGFIFLVTLGFWALWSALTLNGVTRVDPLAWLTASGASKPLRDWDLSFATEFLLAPLLFCVGLDLICCALWLLKWRYTGEAQSRVWSHGALRWWKEALGVYLVLGSALYLGVAVCSWPTRIAAEREIDLQMMRGELPR